MIETEKTVRGPNGPVPVPSWSMSSGSVAGLQEDPRARVRGVPTRNGAEVEAMAVAVPTNSLPAAVRSRSAGSSPQPGAAGAAWSTPARRTGPWPGPRCGASTTSSSPSRGPINRHGSSAPAAGRRPADANVQAKRRSRPSAPPSTWLSPPSTSSPLPRPGRHRGGPVPSAHPKLRVDAAAGDAAGVAGEVAALGWIRDRLLDSFDADELAQSTRGSRVFGPPPVLVTFPRPPTRRRGSPLTCGTSKRADAGLHQPARGRTPGSRWILAGHATLARGLAEAGDHGAGDRS